MQHITTKKYLQIRFYILETPASYILVSHAASFWIGLVKRLCPNKAPRVKRQVSSIDQKRNKSHFKSPFRTTLKHCSIPPKAAHMDSQLVSKMVHSGGVPRPKGHSLMRTCNFEMANATNLNSGRGIINKKHHAKEALETNGSGTVTSKILVTWSFQYSMDSILDGPLRRCNNSEKDCPKRSSYHTKAPHRKYYEPPDHTKILLGSLSLHLNQESVLIA